MARYIYKKLLYGMLVLLGVVTVIFLLFNVLPGDPARMMLGQRADITSVEAINRDLGRDKPLASQYFNFLNDLSPVSFHNKADVGNYWYLDTNKYGKTIQMAGWGKGNVLVLKEPYLRRSYQSKRKVSEILIEAFPVTMLLATVSMLLSTIMGIGLGIICAVRKDTWFDRLALLFAAIGMSLPSFFAAILFAWFFAFVLVDYTGLSMFGSLYSVDDFGRGEYLNLRNLILPAITLGIRPLAIIIQLTRSSLLDVLSQDYIRTAKAKGLGSFRIITHHAMKNAMNPVITAISGWFASLMAGAVFIEYVFDWKGVGVVIVDALEKYDLPVIMGAVLFISIILIIINIFVDLLYGIIDPRVRMT